MIWVPEDVAETGGRRFTLELDGRDLDDIQDLLRPAERALLAVLGDPDASAEDQLMALSLVCRALARLRR